MIDRATTPVEYRQITMLVDGKPLLFPSARGGEFYLENVPAGSYEASFPYAGKTCVVTLTIPASEAIIVDLGEVVCATLR